MRIIQATFLSTRSKKIYLHRQQCLWQNTTKKFKPPSDINRKVCKYKFSVEQYFACKLERNWKYTTPSSTISEHRRYTLSTYTYRYSPQTNVNCVNFFKVTSLHSTCEASLLFGKHKLSKFKVRSVAHSKYRQVSVFSILLIRATIRNRSEDYRYNTGKL